MEQFKMTHYLLLSILSISLSVSCAKKQNEDDDSSDSSLGENPTPATNIDLIQSGDIIISNAGNDSVLLFDSSGQFKTVLYSIPAYLGDAVTGITYNSTTKNLLVAVDGAALDRIVAISPVDGAVINETFIRDPQLTGVIRGITQLSTGDILVAEANNIERFDSTTGIRLTSAAGTAWPKVAIQTNVSHIKPIAGGGFVACSTGSDVVRKYDAAGVQLLSITSNIAATTDAFACIPTSDNGVYVVWSGTTDTIRKYNADYSTIAWSFANASVLSSPISMAVKNNGNLLVIDSVFNHVVEITPDGNLVGILGGAGTDINSLLNAPQFIHIQP